MILKTTFWRLMEPSCLQTRTARTFITILVSFVSKVFFLIRSNWFDNAIVVTLSRKHSWCINKSAHLPPSRPCSDIFSPGLPVFLPPQKTKIPTLDRPGNSGEEEPPCGIFIAKFPSSIIFISFSCKVTIVFDVSIVFFLFKKNYIS